MRILFAISILALVALLSAAAAIVQHIRRSRRRARRFQEENADLPTATTMLGLTPPPLNTGDKDVSFTEVAPFRTVSISRGNGNKPAAPPPASALKASTNAGFPSTASAFDPETLTLVSALVASNRETEKADRASEAAAKAKASAPAPEPEPQPEAKVVSFTEVIDSKIPPAPTVTTKLPPIPANELAPAVAAQVLATELEPPPALAPPAIARAVPRNVPQPEPAPAAPQATAAPIAAEPEPIPEPEPVPILAAAPEPEPAPIAHPAPDTLAEPEALPAPEAVPEPIAAAAPEPATAATEPEPPAIQAEETPAAPEPPQLLESAATEALKPEEASPEAPILALAPVPTPIRVTVPPPRPIPCPPPPPPARRADSSPLHVTSFASLAAIAAQAAAVKAPRLAPPPPSARTSPVNLSQASLAPHMRRPDWAYFNKDMGDLSDPTPPRTRTRELKALSNLKALKERHKQG